MCNIGYSIHVCGKQSKRQYFLRENKYMHQSVCDGKKGTYQSSVYFVFKLKTTYFCGEQSQPCGDR